MKYIVFILFFSLNVLAQDLQIISVPGYKAISPNNIPLVIQYASYYYTELGAKLKITQIDLNSSICNEFHSHLSPEKELYCLEKYSKSQKYHKRKKLFTYYMTPPLVFVDTPVNEGGKQYISMGGIARLCGKTATGHASSDNFRRGEYSIPYAGIILAHETSHMFCLTHVNTEENFMHEAAQNYVEKYKGKVPVSNISKQQFKRFYVKFRKL